MNDLEKNDFVRYYIIPTIIVSANDTVLTIEFKWWSFGFGFMIMKGDM